MKKIYLSIIGAVFFLAILLVALTYLIWPNPIGLQLAAAMKLPAVRMNDTTFTVADLLADQKSINTSTETKDLTATQKNDLILAKLKQEGVINSLITEFKLEINPSDIADLQTSLLRGTNGEKLSDKDVKSTFGYSIQDFTRRVAVPYYNRLQLQKYYILNTPNADKEAITAIRERIIGGESDFDTEAEKINGQKPTEHIIASTDLLGDYQHILEVSAGNVSGIVANADGYRLYLVKNIITDDKEGTYYQLEELFVPTTIFQEKINEALAQATERWYIKKPLIAASN